ncbi:DUF5137 domain-containing protein NDAI_0D00350 [Naumovozyma dairenensis CBS 421]|uniref:Uncharacterized protein n=1 Tax=Naumovozyma dairenensis (strain ATCC 10597 / BCRC 20456 / CBS 421 / NBRC 0211 / NRRL Y-12639) TaxID=1071378 RepID=G0W988_NAUDC|nr:hypothetical protein NDAI_0D00350 [Naumovozyma dairenensis CBS 421]CCD24349.1 hypothetical protein NDAI_0D00350 [Naumovozyma dairenensis CBS 421]
MEGNDTVEEYYLNRLSSKDLEQQQQFKKLQEQQIYQRNSQAQQNMSVVKIVQAEQASTTNGQKRVRNNMDVISYKRMKS